MLSDDLKSEISQLYKTVQTGLGLKNRLTQRQMIAEIAKSIGAVDTNDQGDRTSKESVCLIEAGTGTGKTFGYLIPAIVMAKALGKRLVVSSATVALQEQLVNNDLPALQAHGGIEFNVCLAKGRGRYVCLLRLAQIVNAQDMNQIDLWDNQQLLSQTPLSESGLEAYKTMQKAMATRAWNGERDHWEDVVEDAQWSRVTADKYSCTGQQCEYYKECPFFRAREQLYKADVVVANHDLVLVDLALGGGTILPAPQDTIFCFDEGHHIADKAVQHFAANVSLGRFNMMLDEIARLSQNLPGEVTLSPTLKRFLKRTGEQRQSIEDTVHQVKDLLMPLFEGDLAVYRFSQGQVPDVLRELSDEMVKQFKTLHQGFVAIGESIIQAIKQEKASLEGPYQAVGQIQRFCEQNLLLWQAFSQVDDKNTAPFARWVSLTPQAKTAELVLHASPIWVGDLLSVNLWRNAFSVVITSATLTALGRFDKFIEHAGLPRDSLQFRYASPFDYSSQGTLHLPKMRSDPKKPDEHTEEIVSLLPGFLEKPDGALVLFSSRRQMDEVYSGLSMKLQISILKQSQYSRSEIVKRHKSRIESGEKSVIFGLNSFYEGIDLPGSFCSMVIVAKLPFGHPDDPVKQTLAEWFENQGRNPFMEITVPEASLKLVQATGRLIRNENDCGDVVILDRRLVSARYGAKMLESLPPFKRII